MEFPSLTNVYFYEVNKSVLLVFQLEKNCSIDLVLVSDYFVDVDCVLMIIIS